MTLTKRLTVVIVGWFTCILAVFNILAVIWFRTQSLHNLRTTLALELSDVGKLAAEVPHLSLRNDKWEASALLVSSSIRFIDARGTVTSHVASPDFPTNVLDDADQFWRPFAEQDMRRFVTDQQPSVYPPKTGQGWRYPVSSSFVGTQFQRWLPTFHWTEQGRSRSMIGIEEPFMYPNGHPGRVTVAGTLDTVVAEDARFLQALFYADGFVLLMLGIGTYVVAARGLKPIKDLIDSIRGVEWSLTTRVEVKQAPREIESLANTINLLLEQVEEGIHDQRRFIADASHELRTPLAILAGHANLLRRWGSTNEQVWEPAVHHIVNEVGRLQALVDNLLLLSKYDARSAIDADPLPAEKIRHLLAQLREDGKVLRPDLNWRLAVHIPARVEVRIHPNSLRQILVILIDNAMRHTQGGGSVDLMANADDQLLKISVQDTGEGIPEKDREKVFDRFYRAEKSRSRQLGGSGLGLSICKQVVEAHHGKVTIHSIVGKGTVVTVVLPCQVSE